MHAVILDPFHNIRQMILAPASDGSYFDIALVDAKIMKSYQSLHQRCNPGEGHHERRTKYDPSVYQNAEGSFYGNP